MCLMFVRDWPDDKERQRDSETARDKERAEFDLTNTQNTSHYLTNGD